MYIDTVTHISVRKTFCALLLLCYVCFYSIEHMQPSSLTGGVKHLSCPSVRPSVSTSVRAPNLEAKVTRLPIFCSKSKERVKVTGCRNLQKMLHISRRCLLSAGGSGAGGSSVHCTPGAVDAYNTRQQAVAAEGD